MDTLSAATFSDLSWPVDLPALDDVSLGCDDMDLDPVDEFVSSDSGESCGLSFESYTPSPADDYSDAPVYTRSASCPMPTPSLQAPAAPDIQFVDPQDL